MLNTAALSANGLHRLTTSTASTNGTTLHIDASNNVTVRALLYRAQTPESPHDGEDGELTVEPLLVKGASKNDVTNSY